MDTYESFIQFYVHKRRKLNIKNYFNILKKTNNFNIFFLEKEK